MNDPRNIETERSKALEWWRGLSVLKRSEFTDRYFTGRKQLSLTGREIETIYHIMKYKTKINSKIVEGSYSELVTIINKSGLLGHKIEKL